MDAVFLTVRDYKGKYMLEVFGRFYGKLVGDSIHSVCKSFAGSNAFNRNDYMIFIDSSEFGAAAADELLGFFKIKTIRYDSHKLYART